jgi:hypothetical protein
MKAEVLPYLGFYANNLMFAFTDKIRTADIVTIYPAGNLNYCHRISSNDTNRVAMLGFEAHDPRIELVLHPLLRLTKGQLIEISELALDLHGHHFDKRDWKIHLDVSSKKGVWVVKLDNDHFTEIVRIGTGTGNVWRPESTTRVWNMHEITRKLCSWNFDIFELIEKGYAVSSEQFPTGYKKAIWGKTQK